MEAVVASLVTPETTALPTATVTSALSIPSTTAPPQPNHGETSDFSPASDASPSVNQFPDGPAKTDDTSPEADNDFTWLNVNELNPDEVDSLQKCINTCVQRWKAAGPEARKKMFALFAISGIFISMCRHGHVLVMCDMICSGEL
jgi:hypothetical protein